MKTTGRNDAVRTCSTYPSFAHPSKGIHTRMVTPQTMGRCQTDVKRIEFGLPAHSHRTTHQMKLKQSRVQAKKHIVFFSLFFSLSKLTCCRWRISGQTRTTLYAPRTAKGIKNKSETDNGNRKTIKMLINFFFASAPCPDAGSTGPNLNPTRKTQLKSQASSQVNLTFFLFFISCPVFAPALALMSYFRSVLDGVALALVTEAGKRDRDREKKSIFFIKWMG